MKIYHFLIVGFLILVSLSLINNYPGISTFSRFKDFFSGLSLNNGITNYSISDGLIITFGYSVGLSSLFTLLLKIFSPDPNIYFFYHQNAWIASKIILFLSYLLTFCSLIYFIKTVKTNYRLKKIDLALAYFLSVTLMLSNLALGFFDLLLAPIFIAGLSFFLRRKYILATFAYLLTIIFNWTVLIFIPLFLVFSLKKKLGSNSRFIHLSGYILIFIFAIVTYINNYSLKQLSFFSQFSQLLNIPWLFNHSLTYLSKYQLMSSSQLMISTLPLILTAIVFLFSLAYFTRQVFMKKFRLRKILFLVLIWMGVSTICALFISFPATILLSFIAICLIIWTKYISVGKINTERLLIFSFIFYSVFLLFSSLVSAGNLAWLVIFALLIFANNPSSINKLRLLLIGVITFTILFLSYSTTTLGPDTRTEYLNIFKLLIASAFILITIWQTALLFSKDSLLKTKKVSRYIKYFLILFIILFNLSLIPSQGTSDTAVFDAFNRIAILHSDPFYVHTLTDNQYPPLSTVIYTTFTHLYQNVIGFRQTHPKIVGEFALPTKLSTVVFYFLTAVLTLLFFRVLGKRRLLTKLDILLIFFTTFSLGLQSSSLTATDILTAPAIIISIIFLFRKKYFLAGLFLGISATIKWQPIALFPLFVLTVFNLRGKLLSSLQSSSRLILGLILVPLISWAIVLAYPNGKTSFEIGVVYFLIDSPPLFSGLAMNFNWIVTYFMHILQPQTFGSLERSNWVNIHFPTYGAPKIFQGYFFYFFSAIILFKYWLSPKKDLSQFLTVGVLIYFSHYMFNKGAYHNHSFYFVFIMMLLYLHNPTSKNRAILILFDIMNFFGQIFFYGITGSGSALNRVLLRVDITVLCAFYNLFIYGVILRDYIKFDRLFARLDNLKANLTLINKSTIIFIVLLIVLLFPISKSFNSRTILASVGVVRTNLWKQNIKDYNSFPTILISSVDSMIAGMDLNSYTQLSRDFTPQLRSKINNEQMAIMRDGYFSKIGPLISLSKPTISYKDEQTKLEYHARFAQDNNAKMYVTFLKDQKGKYKISDFIIDSSKLR